MTTGRGVWWKTQLALKRCLDLVAAIAAILLLLPFMLVVAIAIMLESPGNAVYRQKRIGKDGVPFFIYKFRTMYAGSGDGNYMNYLSRLIESERNGSGRNLPYRKMGYDRRVTRLGKILRRLYIDELPQCINIIKGEMSLVGPRPHVQFEVDNYSPEQRRRLSMKPGVTGLWQAEGKAECTFNQLIELDLYYIDHWSFWFDIQIMYKTFVVLLKGGEGCLENARRQVPGMGFSLGLTQLSIPITASPKPDKNAPSADIDDASESDEAGEISGFLPE